MESGRTSRGVDVAVDDAQRIVGAGLWISTPRVPPKTSLSLDDWVRWRRLYGSRVREALEGSRLIWASHVQEPHWHLLAIGTAAAVRGQGYGAVLMTAGLARCRADGLPAHLETAKPENVPYYEQFGFTTIGTVDMPNGGPRNWMMRFEP